MVCGEFCRYYKPWSDLTARCGADDWIMRKAAESPSFLEATEKLRGSRPLLPLQTDALLLRTICTRCEHYPYNCNYRDPQRTKAAEPCGGLVVLDLLLARDVISGRDLYVPNGSSS